MSVKKDVYIAVKKRVLNTTAIKHFALFNSQFDNLDQEQIFPFPCVFMEFAELRYEAVSKGGQKGDFLIRLHVGFESVATEDIEALDILEELHSSMQGFNYSKEDGSRVFDPEDDLFLPFDRVNESQDTNHDNISVWQMEYSTLIHDNSGHVNNGLIRTNIQDLGVGLSPDNYQPRLSQL